MKARSRSEQEISDPSPRREPLPKGYEPARVEQKWYAEWEGKGYFRADPSGPGPRYSIVLPPPNVTGSLHMGHALNITLQDILIRWRRMSGFNVLWIPGTDHAGIATQNVVERQLAEQGKHRTDLGREKFEALVWEWKEKAEENILRQIRRLGCSCDWSRKRFTLDEGLSRAVREVFVRLYEQGLIYRGEYLVNWCPRCETAISDLEVEYQPTEGKLWHIRYPLQGTQDFVVVATTRPETMLGDTAVAVHPEDDRYRHLLGKKILLPLMERVIPVIADSFVEREFGTGVVKVTPGHDPADFEAGRRHGLEVVQVIGEDGRMTPAAGAYAGLDRYEARRKVVEDLEKKGLLAGVEPHSHNVGHCQRCDTVVEPLVSTQWFVKVQPLAEKAIQAVEQKETVFVPENYERVYFEWMRNIHDWCISRQLWWGHRIPAWACPQCGEFLVRREDPIQCPHCGGRELQQETDVLDTWFSSALWPFSTMGWPEKTPELQAYYPTSTLVTGFDIIFFWVARMMMMGLWFMDSVPFRQVYINGLVRDEKGQKMSKSRGNIVDPLRLIDDYGADAVRFTLAVMAVPGTDIPFSIRRMEGYRAFCNKIWNAGRFLLLYLEEARAVEEGEIARLWEDEELELEDRWILGRLQQIILNTNRNLEKFLFHEASNELYHFFWHEFCDWYIELIKPRITGKENGKERAQLLATYVLETSLRLLHPFIPFITEELWQKVPHQGETIMTRPYPSGRREWIDGKAIEQMELLQDLVSSIRRLRSENEIDPRKRLALELVGDGRARDFIESQRHHLLNLANLESVQFLSELSQQGMRVPGVARLAEFALVLDDAIDLQAELERLGREIEKTRKEVERLARQLENREFLEKAPREVVEAARRRHQEAGERLKKLQEKRDGLAQS